VKYSGSLCHVVRINDIKAYYSVALCVVFESLFLLLVGYWEYFYEDESYFELEKEDFSFQGTMLNDG